MSCPFLLSADKPGYHPGGTALRIETTTPVDRCALKAKKDNFGRTHEPVRWVLSGGDPATVADPCTARCPLKVPADIGAYGASWTGPCPLCRTVNTLRGPGDLSCRDCGTEYSLVDVS